MAVPATPTPDIPPPDATPPRVAPTRGGWSSAQLDKQCGVAYGLGAAGHSWPPTRARIHPGGLPDWVLDDLQEAWQAGRLAHQAADPAAYAA